MKMLVNCWHSKTRRSFARVPYRVKVQWNYCVYTCRQPVHSKQPYWYENQTVGRFPKLLAAAAPGVFVHLFPKPDEPGD
jgi:hypothetical protein